MPRYWVQFEVEYDDKPSDNDRTIIRAANEDEAIDLFDGDPLLTVYPEAVAVTAQVAWPV